MRVRTNRMARLKQAIDASPVRRGVLRDAYEWFKNVGELPEGDEHVAYEVVHQALRGGEERAPEDEARLAERVRKAGIAYHKRERPGEAWPPTVRNLLFDEALFAYQPLRRLAGALIATEVAYGGDVESPGFAARYGIPMYGSIAMHIHDLTRTQALPPYEYQAKRLFARFDNIRGRVPQDAPSWFEAAYKALATFRQTGELPDDDLQLELLLVEIEMEQLFGHRHEHDVSKAMALLDKVSRLDGEEGEDALRALCEMAAAGKFRGFAIKRRRPAARGEGHIS